VRRWLLRSTLIWGNNMKVVVRGRYDGKTSSLIRECAASSEYTLIVCHSDQEARRVFQQARNMRLDIPMPITHQEFLEGRFHKTNVKAFYIDNVDMLIQALSRNVSVRTVTLTDERLG
jgi:hypothetical protein